MSQDQTAEKSPNLHSKPNRLGGKIVKWAAALTLLVIVLGSTIVGVLLSTALRPEQPVGFQVVRAVDEHGKPFALGIWYPTSSQTSAKWAGNFFMYVASDGTLAGKDLPLILISHGTGGSLTSHADLALALAAAGNVVATPMHSDNFQDLSSVGSPAYITGRTKQLSASIDHMLNKWEGNKQIEHERIGAYGFSIGGFTVLTAAGAKPDLASVAKYCANNREFACDMLKQSKSFLLEPTLPNGADQFEQDTRIKAVAVAAPGLGFSFKSENAFTNLTSPIQLWQGGKDESVPYASNAKVIQDAIGARVDFQLLANANHYSFLAPCGLLKPAPLCSDPENFNRVSAHKEMNQRITAFFAESLRKK